jgi:hypothetical protein
VLFTPTPLASVEYANYASVSAVDKPFEVGIENGAYGKSKGLFESLSRLYGT